MSDNTVADPHPLQKKPKKQNQKPYSILLSDIPGLQYNSTFLQTVLQQPNFHRLTFLFQEDFLYIHNNIRISVKFIEFFMLWPCSP